MDFQKYTKFLLRHGETELNAKDAYRGMLDPPLDDKGILKAKAAGEFLRQCEIECIISSPLLRCVETAEIVSGILGGRCIKQCRSLFPWQLASMYGLDKEEHKKDIEWYVDNPTKKKVDYEESLDELTDRVGDYFEEALKSPVRTLFVTHNSVLMSLAGLLEGRRTNKNDEMVSPGGIVVDDGEKLAPVFGTAQKEDYTS